MAKEKFEDRTLEGALNVACKFDDGTVRYWTDRKENVVEHILSIVQRYRALGYTLTLRQLHYQFVSKNWIINHDTAYKKLGSILDDCRYSGMVDWAMFEDRGRMPFLPYWVNDVDHALQDTIDQYRIDRQLGQDNYIELWTEKDALSGIFRRSTSKYHIQLVVNKGYTSSAAAYNSYKRIAEQILADKKITVLYFGDHDPSGLDMVRDIEDRLLHFLSNGDTLRRNEEFRKKVDKWWDEHEYAYYDMGDYLSEKSKTCLEKGEDVVGVDRFEKAFIEYRAGIIRWYLDENVFEVKAIGLTMSQIKEYDLPPNPTKMTDTRSDGYIKKFGRTCWEVDALTPEVLTEIIEENIEQKMNMDLYHEMIEREEADIETLKTFINKS